MTICERIIVDRNNNKVFDMKFNSDESIYCRIYGSDEPNSIVQFFSSKEKLKRMADFIYRYLEENSLENK